MAAYAALVSLFNDLELIPNHPTHSFSFEANQIASLSQTVEFLIDFMETYHSHGCTTEAAEALESRIASAAHAAHDVIESHVVNQIRMGSTLDGGRRRSCFLPDLQRAIEGMEFVRTKAMQFKAKSGLKAEQPRYSAAPSTSSSEPLTTEKKKNAMVGFDSVLLRLLDMLTGEPSNQRSVVPIVGMGGIGKTTLARNAYDHSYIQEHFDVRVWATISQDYSVESILTQLLYEERNSNFITCGDVGDLGEELHKKLWGRRYLVVLDDMWNERAWDEVQMYLPDNGNGSRVIVTSRLSKLATDRLSSSYPIEMDFLDKDKSWELFCGKAFVGEEDCPVELEEIGKKIVRRCGGLPLSIVVIGGHLRKSPRAVEYWEKLSNSINPISSIGRDDQSLEILKLSYQHLPACLKPCLLYMGVYPEDHWIDVSQLVRYWVGEGFIRPKKGLILEEVAEDYLEDLIDRNLVLVCRKWWNGKAEYCAIHDVVREICVKVAKKEKFIGVVEDTTRAKGCEERRIVVPAELSSVRQRLAGGLELPLLLRSLVCQGSWFLDDQMSVDLRLLRLSVNVDLDMVVFSGNGIRCPTPNCQQVNLRCLVFYTRSAESLYFIPSPISLLWNLQTLIVRSDFRHVISVPYEIWEMTQLRHLQFDLLCLPDPLPGDGSNQEECIILRNLHTLLGLEDLKLTEEVCKRIPNIKNLGLLYRNLPADDCEEASTSYYCLHNLGRLNKLESLDCYFGEESKWRDVFQSFTFPNSLMELSLSNCHWEDLTKMIKSITQLSYLVLHNVSGSEWDLAEDEVFPHLRILKIYISHGLIDWNASSYNFPVLEELRISSYGANSKLSEIPFDFGEIPTLRLIDLNECSASCALSAMRIVVEQENLGNQDLQLKVHFDEMEEVERFQKMMGEEGLISDTLSLYHKIRKIKAFF